jgi:exonuclease III
MTISKYVPSKVIRYSFPGNYSWPVRLFFLDRCFLVNRYTLANEKELIVINTHNSAYDDGSLRNKQMEYLKIFLKSEYEKGNYIIVGGDWNQCPPNFNTLFNGDLMDFELKKDIPYDFLPKWTWAYDNTLPTNRRVDVPYIKGKTLTTVIDFYLLSPNIKKISIKNIDLGFENSDHNPVSITIKLN